ncbi:fibronectin type III domain-containing protein [Marseilla massiliensis]|uniref:Fibronectin type III domain-containing protein n=1 Tax=Marseilla massiliensis TaxID=1841864 RepID=A0A938WJ62_9BACT|nr:fibronectin type III domain-containing protein [Marseilla massiliensis]MBM6660285.1 fibronectin type III domain-containing protein [Marseilla massiliensis]
MKKSLLMLPALMMCAQANSQQLAFPGAEGFGAYATGGRGGTVVHVTNLNASGPGSLADAVSQPNRTVVFDVGGVIDITGQNLTIASNLTIAGQTAPGEGITIYGGRVIMSNSSNVIMRYIRMRGSISMPEDKCTLTMDYCDNVILDHCSISWGRWDNVHIKDANNITYQNCIISEGIEPQRFGAITDGTRNWTISHCLWTNNKSRNPKMKCYLQYYNNVVYNYGIGIVGGHSAADNYQDVMNNYFITGPSSGSSNKYFDQWTETDHLYSTGNYTDDNRDGKLNGRLITDYNGATPMQQPNLKCQAPMNLEPAEDAFHAVMEHAGASRVRDSHDLRIIEQLASLGTKGAFIANEQDVGGIGTLAGADAPADSDGDGMPDEWEKANGTDPDKADANGDADGNGYTNIEDYVNSLAHKSDYIMYPQAVTATLKDPTTVVLTWKNAEEGADKIVVEMSENGVDYTTAAEVEGNATTATIQGLKEGQVYYFRLKAVKGDEQSLYSAAVSVNDEHMRPAGGIPAGTEAFVPQEGMLYRIINYGTVPYNSGTTYAGAPKYLTFNADGTLGSTTDFEWNNPALLWEITPASEGEGQVYIRNYATREYLNPSTETVGDGARVTAVAQAAPFEIVFSTNETVAQSGLQGQVAMFRINSPQNKGQQLRPVTFEDNWIWGNGTIARADMAFTFSSLDASLLGLYTSALDDAIAAAELAAAEATVGNVTLGYPEEAYSDFTAAIAEAKATAGKAAAGNATQAEVDAAAEAMAAARKAFDGARIMTLAGYDSKKVHNIYSYGTISNSSTVDATAQVERRYLATVKKEDGITDSLVFIVGLSEEQIAAGQADPVSAMPEAQWNIEPGDGGCAYISNTKTGTYLRIAGTLSAEPVTVYPYYAKDDNGKHAFYIETSPDNNRCLNVGTPDADGKGGSIAFAWPADRTRLRWVVDELDIASAIKGTGNNGGRGKPTATEYYNMQGMRLDNVPHNGIYIVKTTFADGTVTTHKATR